VLVEHRAGCRKTRKEVVGATRLNLFQSALTRWCLMEDFLRKLGVPEGGS
jgi:hypothetical protein